MGSTTTPFDVSGKTALITGAGSGINYCFAKLLLSKNCNVVIADLSLRPEAQELVKTYTTSPKCLFVKTDVAQWTDLESAMTLATTTFPTLDIVCPGAGIFEPHWSNFWHPPGTPLSRDTPTSNTYTTLDININHPIRLSQLAISHWLNHPTDRVSPTNPKRILHISSIAGQTPAFPVPLYVASKHAISGFIRSLAPLEAKLGIRVNGVAPGIIKTPLWTDHPEKIKMFKDEVDEWVEPEEVAEAMLQCVVAEEVGGGYVMEVLKGARRNVEFANAKAPEGRGGRVSNGDVLGEEVFGWLGEKGWGVVVPAGEERGL